MSRRAWVLLAAWCGLLVLGIFWVQSHLRVSADLRLFMPSPRTEEQRLLIQNIGESPASRLLLLAIDGDQPARVADLSRRYGAALAARPEFAFVANGAQPPPSIPEELLAYRYLITDSFDAAPLDAQRLASDLEERAADMASPAAGFLEDLLPRDPTLELLHLARIDVHGNGDRPACVEALEPDGDGALTLFAAGGALDGKDSPAAAAAPTRADIEKLCRAPAAPGGHGKR